MSRACVSNRAGIAPNSASAIVCTKAVPTTDAVRVRRNTGRRGAVPDAETHQHGQFSGVRAQRAKPCANRLRISLLSACDAFVANVVDEAGSVFRNHSGPVPR